MNNIQTYCIDCFFFNNVQDMGANIPTCNYHHKLGYCPCNKCDNYVSESKVYEIVYRYLKKRKNKNKREAGVTCLKCGQITSSESLMTARYCPYCGAKMESEEIM